MNKTSFFFMAALLIVQSYAFAVPQKVQSTPVATSEAAVKKFLKIVPIGTYKGTFGKNKKECEVTVTQEGTYFTVDVDGLSTSISLKAPSVVKESKTSLAIIDEEEDGDEAHGAYIFTRTARATKLKGSLVKVSVIEEKEYLDEDRDTEVEAMSCTIKP